MYESYRDIFDRRGVMYHKAMMHYPLARKEEFCHIIKLANLQDNQVLCDIPSGGCYISRFIEKSVKIISVETSEEFIRYSEEYEQNTTIVCDDLSCIPVFPNVADCVISLAGLHHLVSKEAFYQEVHRLLKPTGIFCLADVRKTTSVADFLNLFVDQHSSMGHQGDFLDESAKDALTVAGFNVVFCQPMSYHWSFDCTESMINFCGLLFGIDQADADQILEGIQKYLGYQLTPNGQCFMNWELYFLKGIKY